jgi:hypothetical protein
VMLCSGVVGYQHSGGPHCFYLQYEDEGSNTTQLHCYENFKSCIIFWHVKFEIVIVYTHIYKSCMKIDT